MPARPITPSTAQNATSPEPKATAAIVTEKYQGAARPQGVPAVKKDIKPQSLPSTAQSTVKSASKPVPKPTASTVKPAGPTSDKPKKLSYAELIAQAKAKQAAKAPVGVIMHKQVEKVDRKALTKEAAKEKNGLKDKKLADRSRTSSAEVSSKVGEKTKKPRPLEKSTYQGSAKPVTPTYTGSARPALPKKPPPKRYDGYAGTDEEIDDYDEEEDYYSDESDMEAGAFDVEREEQEALRQAKRDDAAELALENKLKAEKLAKKRALEELAASRKKSRG